MTDAEAIAQWLKDHADEQFQCLRMKALITEAGCARFRKPSAQKGKYRFESNPTRDAIRSRLCAECPRNPDPQPAQPVRVFSGGFTCRGKPATLLQEQRIKIGFTQRELAEVLGINFLAYEQYERGQAATPEDVQQALSSFFGQPWSSLEGKL